MATTSSTPEGVYFELSPKIVLGVRLVNIITLLVVVITLILCLVKGEQNSANYLLAGNTVISAFVGIVVNWWYRGGDLGSDKFWYILLVAAVLVFQCVASDVFLFKVTKETVVSPTLGPVNASTHVFTWASFRPTNRSLLHGLRTTPSSSFPRPLIHNDSPLN
ncbi:uncharacterized protein LOC143294304 [Babylonia areolata]|uniref:uncharacterized protein LOC143294304 n=1 Tax=Babylonia areolata TaxID=304850 RepID=UPI003FCFF14A